jgi:uncharacterized protein (TIGR02466 family)
VIEQDIFPTLILEDNLDLNVKAMNDYAYETRKKGHIRDNSNIGGQHPINVDLEEPVLQPLIKYITKMSHVYSKKLLIDKKYVLTVVSMWFIINNHKDYIILHTHPGAYLSGVFYSRASVGCGKLVFKNPNPRLESYWRPKYFKMYTPCNNAVSYVKPQTNGIMMFPSWLEHYVEHNENKEDRIAWSFNLELTQEDK